MMTSCAVVTCIVSSCIFGLFGASSVTYPLAPFLLYLVSSLQSQGFDCIWGY